MLEAGGFPAFYLDGRNGSVVYVFLEKRSITRPLALMVIDTTYRNNKAGSSSSGDSPALFVGTIQSLVPGFLAEPASNRLYHLISIC